MAKRTNPAVVGAFVLGGAALVIALVLVLGAGRWFSNQYEFVCFFGGDLNGLKVGAPVKFRGVQIGTVSAIRINLPGRITAGSIVAEGKHKLRLPVLIQLDESEFATAGAKADILMPEKIALLIKSGPTRAFGNRKSTYWSALC
jgi:paraquat-inducible protein B